LGGLSAAFCQKYVLYFCIEGEADLPISCYRECVQNNEESIEDLNFQLEDEEETPGNKKIVRPVSKDVFKDDKKFPKLWREASFFYQVK